MNWDDEVDVLVVGSGGGGVTGAYTAAREGLAVAWSGHGRTLPYGLAGSAAERTMTWGSATPEGHGVSSGLSAKSRT